MADKPNTSISWHANEEYLENFNNYFKAAQAYFQMCKMNRSELPNLFDKIHEVWRMENPYFETSGKESEKATMAAKHEILRRKVMAYQRTRSEYTRKMMFISLYDGLDTFFTELTEWAVRMNFFPRAVKPRTAEDISDSLRQR